LRLTGSISGTPHLIADPDQRVASIRRAQRSGRPPGSTDLVDYLEETLGRKLRKGKPGPKAQIK
jgi:hypothetical protein